MVNVNQSVSDNLSFTDTVQVKFELSPNSTGLRASNVRSIIETYKSDGTINTRKIVGTTINASVQKDSERAVDTASFTFPAQTSVDIGNGILYVQDIVDTSYLRALWNFHYNILDESGFALDGTSTNEAVGLYDVDVFSNIRFYNTVYRKFTADGDHITITDPTSRADGLNGQIMDFSGQFDIMFWFTCDSTSGNPKVILDKLNGGTTGISIYVSTGASGVITVDMYNSSVLTNITGSTVVNDSKWHFARIVRNGVSDIKLYVDGVQDGSTANSSSSFQNNTPSLVIGNVPASHTTHFFSGRILQMRIYCGGILSDNDASLVFSSKPQPYTMKFGGPVWKIDDNTDNKVVYCKSFAQQLGLINLTYDNLTTSSGSPPASPYIAHNVYVGKTADVIITDFFTNLLSSWTLRIVPTFGTSIAKYVASGTLLTNMFYLLYTESSGVNGGKLTFFTTARKVLIIENTNVDHTQAAGHDGALNFIGVQAGGKYDITNDGADDSVYTNDVQVSSFVSTASFHETDSPGVGVLRSKTLQFAPISATVQVPAGTYLKMDNSASPAVNTFQIDTLNKQIVFSTAPNPSTVVIDYQYEDTANLFWRSSDATGVTQNGTYSKIYNIPQLQDYFSIRLFVANILTRFGNSGSHVIPQRIRIVAPNLVNAIRENFKVSVVSGVKGINTSATVKQITWTYPNTQTVIELGDFVYDMYDLYNTTNVNTLQNQQAYTDVKNVTKSSS